MQKIDLKNHKFVLVDDADFELVSKRKWYLETNGYIRARIDGKIISMHRYLMGLKNGDKSDVDHINGLRYDNRRINLRLCTRSQNLANTRLHPKNKSGFKGVSWSKEKNKWIAKITSEGKQHHLGYFDTAEKGYAAFCSATDLMNGEFANHGAEMGVQFHANPNEGAA